MNKNTSVSVIILCIYRSTMQCEVFGSVMGQIGSNFPGHYYMYVFIYFFYFPVLPLLAKIKSKCFNSNSLLGPFSVFCYQCHSLAMANPQNFWINKYMDSIFCRSKSSDLIVYRYKYTDFYSDQSLCAVMAIFTHKLKHTKFFRSLKLMATRST